MQDPSFVVISGGSACNFISNTFQSITPNVCYVLGISDNGGSTSELLRVLGGPSIGDLRSRLTRLITTDGKDALERMAIKELMSYRLPCHGDEHKVRDEWSLIVEGRHRLWHQISIEKKETIRGFLVAFNSEIMKRAHKHFNFRNGSIGNFFLTGARLFFGSLEAAIFLFSAITAIRDTHVVPVINTNHTAAIAAILENGQILRGQCDISHPGENKSSHSRLMNPIDAFSKLALPNSPIQNNPDDEQVNENLVFSKLSEEKLSAAIRRIYYMNEYGQEIYPLPNPKVIGYLSERNTLVYSIGSLYTSILPCLILRGIGNAIANSTSLKYKVLILNGTPDRETDCYTAVDFIGTITNALNESQLIDARHQYYDTHMDEDMMGSYHQMDTCQRPVDHGFRQWPPPPPKPMPWQQNPSSETISRALNGTIRGDRFLEPLQTSISPSGFRTPPFPSNLIPNSPPSAFITHLIYLKNSGKFLKK
ncbi:hypothetical protein BC941DRAFT_421282 [Chlamydoabsidia padenii]|nr:hypothetical protein BC941DRAFT_421282 [Chlamydoabsidia padenii]